MAGLKKGNRKSQRNPELIQGVRRYGRHIQSAKSLTYKKAKLGAKGSKVAPKNPKVAKSTKEPKFYDADDVSVPLRSNKHNNKPTKLRKSITPGTVVIVLAGRFRGKRVIVLKQLLPSGLLLVTGPYKVNGVPLRRVNQAYVIATSTKVDVSSVDVSKIDDKFFARSKQSSSSSSKKKDDFLDSKNEKKVEISKDRKDANKKVDSALQAIIKKTPQLRHYLNAKFTLTQGQYPHQLKF